MDHPEDRDLGAAGIELMAATADPEQRLPILELGIDHFFFYDQRTDNCANCKPGDRTGQLVRDLAYAYIAHNEPLAAIEIIERLVREREADVSPYNLALTFEAMASAYWSLKDIDGAKAAIEEGLRRFPSGWQADQLRRARDRYEKAGVPPARPETLQLPQLALERLREQCNGFGEVKPGAGPADFRECRVTESGELGVVDGETYLLRPLLPDARLHRRRRSLRRWLVQRGIPSCPRRRGLRPRSLDQHHAFGLRARRPRDRDDLDAEARNCSERRRNHPAPSHRHRRNRGRKRESVLRAHGWAMGADRR